MGTLFTASTISISQHSITDRQFRQEGRQGTTDLQSCAWTLFHVSSGTGTNDTAMTKTLHDGREADCLPRETQKSKKHSNSGWVASFLRTRGLSILIRDCVFAQGTQLNFLDSKIVMYHMLICKSWRQGRHKDARRYKVAIQHQHLLERGLDLHHNRE